MNTIRIILTLSCIALTTGCANIALVNPPTSAQSSASETTEARAERVFRYESRIADGLLDRYPLQEEFASADPRLIAAEAAMTRLCGPLVRAVLAHLDGQPTSLALKLDVMGSLDACEAAASQVTEVIEKLDQSLVASGGL